MENPTGSELAEQFIRMGFEDGEVVDFETLYDLVGVPMPALSGTYSEGKSRELAFMARFEPLRAALLREYQKDFQNVRSRGYRLIPFHERVDCAVRDGRVGVRKELNRAANRLSHIPHPEQLTGEDQRKMDHTLGIFGFFETMLRKRNPREKR